MSLLIEKGTLVLENEVRQTDLLVEGERILAIGEKAANLATQDPHCDVLDAEGLIVLPGAVDGHTHLDMPFLDFASTDDFFTGTRAALLGGTTCIVDYAEQGETLADGLETWKAKAEGMAVADYGFHMTIKHLSDEVIEEMGAMVQAGVVTFKVFMAYPGRMMLQDDEIERVMRRAAELGAGVNIHAEDGILIEDLIRRTKRAKATDPIDHALTRPSVGEARAVDRAIALVRTTGAQLVVVHMSCAQAVDLVADARKDGLPVYGETCPQYLWLEQRKLKAPGLQGAVYICSPPLRDVTHMHALWKGLAAGTVSMVGTDHCPFDLIGQKDRGLRPDGSFDFTLVPGGLPGIETRLLLLYAGGVLTGRFDLVQLARVSATQPAGILGLYPEKGAIRVGADADLVVLDPDGLTSLDAEDLHMRVDHSPYEGMRVEGSIEFVFSRGELVVESRQFKGTRGRGKYIARRPPAAAGPLKEPSASPVS